MVQYTNYLYTMKHLQLSYRKRIVHFNKNWNLPQSTESNDDDNNRAFMW